MADNFGFDEFDGFESGIDTSGLDESIVTESDSFGGFENANGPIDNTGGDKRGVIKTAAIAIAVSAVIIVGAFVVMRLVQDKVKEPSVVNKAVGQVEQSTKTVEETPTQVEKTPTVVQNTLVWKEFSSSDKINFTEEYVDSIFTVVNMKNYVKIVDIESNLMVKTVVSGSLSGFIGTYELILPYNKASHLLTGNSFNVRVQLGKFNDKVVVGEIKY